MKRFLRFSIVLLTAVGILPTYAHASQVITVVVPQFWDALIDDAIVADFETQYGVDVQFVYENFNQQRPTTPDSVDDYAESLTEYASSADVLYVSTSWLSPEMTRAGFILDLTLLAQTDANLDPGAFYPVAWESLQWDGGMWGVPIAAEPLLVDFIPAAFNNAGLAYPSANWTIDDYANAARALAEYDSAGTVTLPGMVINNSARDALFRALIGTGFYDPSTFPDVPRLNVPSLDSILETWSELLAEGVITVSGNNFGNRFNEIPMQIGGGSGVVSIRAVVGSNDDGDGPPGGNFNFLDNLPQRALAPMPNDQAGVQVTGFAVSSGTTNVDLAYELVRYLSEQRTVAQAVFNAKPARLTYTDSGETGRTVTIIGGPEPSPEDAALIEATLSNGLAAPEYRYTQYIGAALNEVQSGVDGVSALQEAELNALDTVTAFDNLDVTITVTNPEPVVLAAGEIALDFGYLGATRQFINEDAWKAAIAEFAAQDPQVGTINLDTILGQPDLTANDCTYVPNTNFIDIDPATLLALDPLIYSDPNLSVNDFAPGALDALMVDGMIYGMPITVQPQMLSYDPAAFSSAGVPEPLNGWTVAEFETALISLKTVIDADASPFVPQSFGNVHLLMMIAANGGLPVDTRTDPVMLDFTSPQSVAAIQTVLDWARNGLMDYQAQSGPAGGGFVARVNGAPAPITSTFFGGFGGGPGGVGARQQARILTTYPSGFEYNPVSYDVGAGYVSVDTAYGEACYRWFSYLSQHPELFTNAMPAVLTALNQPQVKDSLPSDTLAAYLHEAQLFTSPNAVNLNISDPFMLTWLNNAFDAYVLEDADLMTALEDAQQSTLEYLACTANLDAGATFQDLNECVQQVNSAGSL